MCRVLQYCAGFLQYCAGVYNIVQGFTLCRGLHCAGVYNIGVYDFNGKGLSNWL